MQTRKLGQTNLELTSVGLGTWAMGGGGWRFSWGPQEDSESIAAIKRAMEKGVNWLDTAPVYGLGHAEEVVGSAIRKLKPQPIIATKCSRVWDAARQLGGCLKRKSILAEVDASLKRLGIDVIDLYQIHWPIPEEDIEEGWSAVAEIVKAGKVRYAGVSNFSVAQMKRIQPIHPIASLQTPYSMLMRDFENDLSPFCRDHNIGVLVYSPLQKGLLTGKVSRDRLQNLPSDDHRRLDPMFQGESLDATLALVDSLKPLAAKYGKTLTQLAIAWVLRRPEVTTAIVGVRTPSQVDEIVGGADWQISTDDCQAIERLLTQRRNALSGMESKK